MKYRKLPVEIDAIRWTGDNIAQVHAFLGEHWIGMSGKSIMMPTLHGPVRAEPGAWICKGARDFWPVDRDTFLETYEPVDREGAPEHDPATCTECSTDEWSRQAADDEAANATLTNLVLGAEGGALIIQCQACGVSDRYPATLTLTEVIDSHRCAVPA